MAVSTYASGSQSASIGTEHFVASVNVPGVFVFWVDLANMAAQDFTELRAYKIAKAGGAVEPHLYWPIYGAPPTWDKIAELLAVTNSLTDTNSVRFSILQVAGTGRSYDWGVDQIG